MRPVRMFARHRLTPEDSQSVESVGKRFDQGGNNKGNKVEEKRSIYFVYEERGLDVAQQLLF